MIKIRTERQAKEYILERVGAELSFQNNLASLLNKYAKAILKAKHQSDIDLLINALIQEIVYDIELLATSKSDDDDEDKSIIAFISKERRGETLKDIISRHVHKWRDGLKVDGPTDYFPLTRYGRYIIAWGWTKLLFDDAMRQNIVAFRVKRGSSYPCEICDAECRYIHTDLDSLPPYHAHCCCYIVPIYAEGKSLV